MGGYRVRAICHRKKRRRVGGFQLGLTTVLKPSSYLTMGLLGKRDCLFGQKSYREAHDDGLVL